LFVPADPDVNTPAEWAGVTMANRAVRFRHHARNERCSGQLLSGIDRQDVKMGMADTPALLGSGAAELESD